MKKVNLAKIKPADIRKLLAGAWMHYYKWVFLVYFSAVIGAGAFLWYRNLNGVSWSAEQKSKYLETIDTSVSFKEGEFKRVLDNISARREQYAQQLPETADIFNRN